MLHAGSILATPRGVRALEATSVDDLDATALAPLFAECAERPGSIEFLVVGTGARMAPIAAALKDALKRRRPAVRSDGDRSGRSGSTTSCKSENRRVAAALIAAP